MPNEPSEPRPLELLEREICELSAHMSVGICRWLLLVAEFDERDGWAEWGVGSCAEWLSWRCSIAPRAGREHVRVARRLKGLPLVIDAFAAGRLSYSKVRALTRVATPENEQYLLMLAEHATGAQLEKIVAGYRGVLSATTEGAQQAHSRRYLYCTQDDDGSLLIQARLPAEDGALLLAALEHADRAAHADREPGSAEPTELAVDGSAEPPPDTLPARRADALTTLARAQLASDSHQHAGSDPVELTVHIDIESLASEQIDERSELAGGPSIAPETARRLGCDASLVRIIERDGRPLTVGRRTRTIPPALKRALRDRDQHCRFPGCNHQRYLHAHHIHHWARGGPTNLENLIHLCPHHHRLVHEHGYTIQHPEPHTLRFHRPDGRPIPDHPPPPRPTGPNLQQQTRAHGIAIDPTTNQPLSAGQPLDYGMAIEGLLQEDGHLRPKPPAESDDDPPPDPRSPRP